MKGKQEPALPPLPPPPLLTQRKYSLSSNYRNLSNKSAEGVTAMTRPPTTRGSFPNLRVDGGCLVARPAKNLMNWRLHHSLGSSWKDLPGKTATAPASSQTPAIYKSLFKTNKQTKKSGKSRGGYALFKTLSSVLQPPSPKLSLPHPAHGESGGWFPITEMSPSHVG